jgi:hypothetical protein
MFYAYTAVVLMFGSLIGKYWRWHQHKTALLLLTFIAGFAYLVRTSGHSL